MVLDNEIPAHLSARWQPAPALTPERYRFLVRNRVVAITVGVTTLIGLVGAVAWWRRGDTQFLVAALAYALLPVVAVVVALVIVRRKLAGS